MIKQFYRLLIRWFIASLGLYIVIHFLNPVISSKGHLLDILIAGLILAIINAVIKPILVILFLPAILFTLGFFMIIINGLTVYLASRLYPPLHIQSFWTAIFAGIIIGILNYLVSTILEERYI